MSISIEVTGLDTAIANMEDAKSVHDRVGEGLLGVVDEILIPNITDASSIIYNVRTRAYSQGWYSFMSDPLTVTVKNIVTYATPLEYGWTTRDGGFRESEGVAIPTTLGSASAIGEGLATWLRANLP